ncbi:hypothetical protein KCP69_19055 [Salmonella enterica subsp. enterica]|nr:hypothetical protein KCP69_19055 [Salmonella enterica subsp. enterica]
MRAWSSTSPWRFASHSADRCISLPIALWRVFRAPKLYLSARPPRYRFGVGPCFSSEWAVLDEGHFAGHSIPAYNASPSRNPPERHTPYAGGGNIRIKRHGVPRRQPSGTG